MQSVAFIILGLSILLQLVAAVLALRLINVTGRKAAWIFIAAAVSLMAVRRSITFFQLITGEFAGTLDITAELVALLISILMVAGIAGIGYLFRSVNKVHQEKLKSEAWFRAIFDSTFQFIAMLKPDGTMVEVNRTALEFSGIKAEDIIGRSFWEAHPWTIDAKTRQRLKAAIVEAAHGTFVRYEVDILGAGDRVVTIDFSLKPITNNNGEVEYLLAEGRDITERKQAESKLQERERAYHALLSNLSGMAYRCRNDGSWNMEFVSNACREITGYEAADLKDNNKVAFGDLVHPDDREWLWNKCQTHLDNREPCSNEYRIINASGRVVWVWDQAHGIYSDAGELVAIEGLITDITDAKMISQELKQERDFSTAVINTIGSVVTVLDRDGRIVRFNKAAQELTGYSLDEVADREIWNLLIPPEQINDVKEVFSYLKAAVLPSHYENHWLTRTGEKRLLAWNNTVLLDGDGDGEYVIATGIDITSHRRMEKSLRLLAVTASTPGSDGFFRQCVHNLAEVYGASFASMGLLSADRKSIRTLAVWTGDGYADNFEYSLSGTPCEDILECRQKLIARNVATEYPQDKFLVDMGIESYFGTLLESSSGERYGVLSVMNDKPMELIPATESLLKVFSIRIATELERKYYFDELDAAAGEWTQAMDAFEDAVYLSGTDNILLRANQAFYNMTGLSQDQAVGMYLTDIMHPEGEKTPCPVCQARKELRDAHIVLEAEGDNRFRKPVEVTIKIIRDDDGNPQRILGTVHDLSRTRKIEEELNRYRYELEELVKARTKELEETRDELVRKERLATLGQLTATVGHELRNPLASMMTSLYIIEKQSDKSDEQLSGSIERLGRNISRCDRIVDELLDFTRVKILELEPVILDEWLKDIVEEQPIHPDIKVIQTLTLGDDRVMLDVSHFRRALINVIDNACHAMHEGYGSDKIMPGAQLTIETKATGERIEIRVKDTGMGIPGDVFPNIFEPLYSTKSFGVGLGMSVVRQIMEQHGGGIEVASEQGKGTTMLLWLPVMR